MGGLGHLGRAADGGDPRQPSLGGAPLGVNYQFPPDEHDPTIAIAVPRRTRDTKVTPLGRRQTPGKTGFAYPFCDKAKQPRPRPFPRSLLTRDLTWVPGYGQGRLGPQLPLAARRQTKVPPRRGTASRRPRPGHRRRHLADPHRQARSRPTPQLANIPRGPAPPAWWKLRHNTPATSYPNPGAGGADCCLVSRRVPPRKPTVLATAGSRADLERVSRVRERAVGNEDGG